MVHRTLGQKVASVIDAHIKGRMQLPSHVLILESEDPAALLSRKRMEILRLLKEERSMQQLAKRTHRNKTAVSRDIHALVKAGIVVLRKEGRKVVPATVADAVVITFNDDAVVSG